MKKIAFIMLAVVSMALVSCGGGGSSSSSKRGPEISLDELDDYYDVKSYKLETNAEEKGMDHLDAVKGTLTLVLKRNKEEMKLKASQIESANVKASPKGYDGFSNLFYGECDGLIKRIVKENEKEVTLEIPIKGIDPAKYSFDSEEKKEEERTAFYNALTKSECLGEINLNVYLKDE